MKIQVSHIVKSRTGNRLFPLDAILVIFLGNFLSNKTDLKIPGKISEGSVKGCTVQWRELLFEKISISKRFKAKQMFYNVSLL